MRRLLLLTVLSSAGCYADPGEGDPETALEIVYAPSGVPSFAGQALVVQSCGAGNFCHTDGIEDVADHYGAPEGLGFDLRIASVNVDFAEEDSRRLLRDQLRLLDHHRLVWEQVSSGRMPPDGEVGEEYRDSTAGLDGAVWERVAEDGVTFSPLPGLDTEEGLEIFRNWLAAGAPVVERTVVPASREPNVTGYTVPLCERTCIDVTWDSIYEGILVPTCSQSRCHDDDEAAGDLNMLTGGAEALHARILGTLANESVCRVEGLDLLVAGDPESSLLYLKVSADSSADVCGAKMPLAGNPLTDQRLCAIREWIACGACADADDPACASCAEAARAACGVAIEDGAPTCLEQPICANRAEL